MRPEILYPLFASPLTLSGVGPHLAKRLEQIGCTRVMSLLWHLPTSILHRRFVSALAQARSGEVISLKVHILDHKGGAYKGAKAPYRVTCSDGVQLLDLIFFHMDPSYIRRQLPVGEERLVSGKLEVFHHQWQMVHPDYIGPMSQKAQWEGAEPLYPLTQGISQRQMRKIVHTALLKCPQLPEWISQKTREEKSWPLWNQALNTLHHPQKEADIDPLSPASQRLAYDELLANQLALLLVRNHQVSYQGKPFPPSKTLRAQARTLLPFELTLDQEQALKEIDDDMNRPERMLRLLQGDVGSGKTLVAFFALLNVIEQGAQGALMAPTEVLARQHYRTLAPWAEALGLRIKILTGREKGKQREEIYQAVSQGEIDLLVGTHALIQEGVGFKDLALAVVDEQHRFGVEQRVQLFQKGAHPHVLTMTATPIPRTLQMTAYGDLECSYLRHRPAGRQPIRTHALPVARLKELIAALNRALEKGEKVYWICPLVEESESLDLAAAVERFTDLDQQFPGLVGLVHGRLKAVEKDKALESFQKGETRILVATTVIEVGIDVQDATVMVIEHAERFGLAQLHQLRGRIGRGDKPATCLLFYQGPLNEVARARLEILRETNDGFRIAEEDLRLRGGGEILGLKQSGLPQFKLADLSIHGSLLKEAHQEAKTILKKDPYLISPTGRPFRLLLSLFDYQDSVQYLQAV